MKELHPGGIFFSKFPKNMGINFTLFVIDSMSTLWKVWLQTVKQLDWFDVRSWNQCINLYLSTSSFQHSNKTHGQTAVFKYEIFLTQKTNGGILKAVIGNRESCHLADFQNRPCFHQQSFGLCDQSIINCSTPWLVKQAYHEALQAKYISDRELIMYKQSRLLPFSERNSGK